MPSAISYGLSLISRIHSCLFLNWRCTVSSKFFDILVPLISTKELVLLRHARCVLSRHSLLLSSYLSRIGRIENPSCSPCRHLSQDISRLILHSPVMDSLPLALWQFCVSTTSGLGPGELPGFWGSMVFCHAPIPRKGSGNNNCKIKITNALSHNKGS